jgi:hypothetical protein
MLKKKNVIVVYSCSKRCSIKKESVMPITFSPMNRRKFLASSFAVGVLTACSSLRSNAAKLGALNADVPNSTSEHWVLLSDVHLGANPDTLVKRTDAKGNKYSPYNHFVAAREEILALTNKPKGVIVTGDFALDKGKIEDYELLATLIAPIIAAEIPVHVAMGNHDRFDKSLVMISFTKVHQTRICFIGNQQISVIMTGINHDKTISSIIPLREFLDHRKNPPVRDYS